MIGGGASDEGRGCGEVEAHSRSGIILFTDCDAFGLANANYECSGDEQASERQREVTATSNAKWRWLSTQQPEPQLH